MQRFDGGFRPPNFNKPPLAILNGTSNPIGLHNEHALFQRISIHLHYHMKASKHLASLLTTDVSALSQQRIVEPMFFDTTVTSQAYIENTGGHADVNQHFPGLPSSGTHCTSQHA
jgi:hypothetical protein